MSSKVEFHQCAVAKDNQGKSIYDTGFWIKNKHKTDKILVSFIIEKENKEVRKYVGIDPGHTGVYLLSPFVDEDGDYSVTFEKTDDNMSYIEVGCNLVFYFTTITDIHYDMSGKLVAVKGYQQFAFPKIGKEVTTQSPN